MRSGGTQGEIRVYLDRVRVLGHVGPSQSLLQKLHFPGQVFFVGEALDDHLQFVGPEIKQMPSCSFITILSPSLFPFIGALKELDNATLRNQST